MNADVDWDLETIKFTAFGSAINFGQIKDYWHQLFDAGYEQIQESPPARQSVATATINEMRYTLVVSPVPTATPTNMLQLQLQGRQIPNEFEKLGSWSERVPDFVRLSAKLLDRSLVGLIDRLALYVVANQFYDTPAESYDALKYWLPHLEWDSTASDLIFQINRPTRSTKVTNMLINRLVTWAAQELIIFPLPAGVTGLVPLDPLKAGKRSPVARVVLDLSTSKDYGQALDAANLKELWEELVIVGEKILRDGDKISS